MLSRRGSIHHSRIIISSWHWCCVDKEQNGDIEFANDGGRNTRGTSGFEQEVKIPYPIVGKEYNQTKNPSRSRTPNLTSPKPIPHKTPLQLPTSTYLGEPGIEEVFVFLDGCKLGSCFIVNVDDDKDGGGCGGGPARLADEKEFK